VKTVKNFKGDIRGKFRDPRQGESQSLVMRMAMMTTKGLWFGTTMVI
jgi:hypothetical protein